jgi:predicted Zn-dependent peptidase
MVFGDHRKLFQTVDLISRITLEQVRQVARKYFSPQNRTVAVLVPEAEPAAGK